MEEYYGECVCHIDANLTKRFLSTGSAISATRVCKGTAIIRITATRASTASVGRCSPPFVS